MADRIITTAAPLARVVHHANAVVSMRMMPPPPEPDPDPERWYGGTLIYHDSFDVDAPRRAWYTLEQAYWSGSHTVTGGVMTLHDEPVYLAPGVFAARANNYIAFRMGTTGGTGVITVLGTVYPNAGVLGAGEPAGIRVEMTPPTMTISLRYGPYTGGIWVPFNPNPDEPVPTITSPQYVRIIWNPLYLEVALSDDGVLPGEWPSEHWHTYAWTWLDFSIPDAEFNSLSLAFSGSGAVVDDFTARLWRYPG